MDLRDAQAVATRLREMLAPYCHRIEIAGSIRRKKRDGIKDVELVAIPKFGPDPALLFGDAGDEVSLLDVYLNRVVNAERSTIRKDDTRPPCWGPKSKRLRFEQTVSVDLFIVTPPAQWGVQLLLRTGPSDFSRRIVTTRDKGGHLPNHYRFRKGQIVHRAGPVLTAEEQDVFSVVGLPWIEPHARR